MPIFHLNSLPKKKRIQMIGEFYDIFFSLKTRENVRFFLKSLLTPEEIATFMRRVEIAVLLAAGYGYVEIKRILGVGNNKISAVHKALQQDDNGYKIVIKTLIDNRIKRLKRIKKENKEEISMSLLANFKKSHPQYFVLDNLLDAAISKITEDNRGLEEEAVLYTPSKISFVRKRNKKRKK